jgi:predicted acylesterase/phospholipase RssA
MPPVSVQVVFQGGGAKICVLTAVCDVLKKLADDQRIKITRVAGSSAGAIAAVMLGSQKPISDFKFALRIIAEKHLPLMVVPKYKGAWRVYKGRPWFHEIRLATIFNELFCKNGGPQYVSDLPILTEIYTTDLYTLKSKPIARNESIPQALAKSCNFPFAFIGPGSDQMDVDGGLALNLPVDNLYKDKAIHGDVIAISFTNQFVERTGNPVISFAKNLFSASIQSGVERSKSIIGEQNVFSIDTDIDTFDFPKILKDGLTKDYTAAYKAFTEWFTGWLAPYEKTPESARTPSSRFIRATVGDLRPALVRQIDDDIKSMSPSKSKEIFLSYVGVIDEYGNFTGRYRVNMTMSMTVLVPTNILQMNFEIGAAGLFSDAHLLCAASSSHGEIPFTPRVQELARLPEEGLRRFRLYYYFDEQLVPRPDEIIAIQYQYEADDPFPKLGTGKEMFALSPMLGDAEVIVLVAAFPRNRIKHEPKIKDLASLSEAEREMFGVAGWVGRLVPSQKVGFPDVAGRVNLDTNLDEYRVEVRRAHNVNKGHGCGFAIE